MLSKTFDAGSHRVTVRTRRVPKSDIFSSYAKWYTDDVYISVVIDKVLYKDIGFIRRHKGFNLDFHYWEFDYDDCPIRHHDTFQKNRKEYINREYTTFDKLFEQACEYVKSELETKHEEELIMEEYN